MKKSGLHLAILLVPCIISGMVVIPEGNKQTPQIHLGSRLELFVDSFLIESLNNLELRIHAPVAMDFGTAPIEELYTNQTSPYFRAPHIYIAVAARFFPGKQIISDEQAKRLNGNPDQTLPG